MINLGAIERELLRVCMNRSSAEQRGKIGMVSKTNTYAILNYGCQMNESDAEEYAGILEKRGFIVSENPSCANVVIINTCCVRESAEKKIWGKIGEFKRYKRENPEMLLVVAGCMAQKDQEGGYKRAPHVDIFLGTSKAKELDQFLENRVFEEPFVFAPADGARPEEIKRNKKISAWLPIMYGCNKWCTYCIVPKVRGPERSRSLEDILKEVTELALNGYKEITLLGQNVNSYGLDLPQKEKSFSHLLEKIAQVPGIERIRFMTSHPRDLDEETMDVMMKYPNICNHLHLPVQSGSDEILKRMNRGYTTEKYRNLIHSLRIRIPNIVLTTDLIVGFPGETEEQFMETVRFVEEIGYDQAYIFIYSPRSGTPAAEFENQISEEEKKERHHRLSDAQDRVGLLRMKAWEGRKTEVLVEGPTKNDIEVLCGRNEENKLILWPKKDGGIVGEKFMVHIEKAQTFILKGRGV